MNDAIKLHENFFDWNEPEVIFSPKTDALTKRFLGECSDFLTNDYFVLSSKAKLTAWALYGVMSSRKLHYHTPVHVLSLFDFATAHNIELACWEKLAIWFHDAVYDPAAPLGENEQNSAALMRTLLDGYIPHLELSRTELAIQETARYMSDSVISEFKKILDLDVCGFAWDRPIYCRITECLRKEYGPKFDQGRKQFLIEFLKKGFIYRTPEFAKFEAQAQENIQKDIEEL